MITACEDGGIDTDHATQFDPAPWLETLTPDAAADMCAIIDAVNPRVRARAVGAARDNGRSWRNIATAITANEQRTPEEVIDLATAVWHAQQGSSS